MYEIEAQITTDNLPVRTYRFCLDRGQNDVVTYKGTDEAVDGLMDIICNSVALGRGDSAHFEDLLFDKKIDQNDVTSYRDGSKISFSYSADANTIIETVSFEYDQKNHVCVTLIAGDEKMLYGIDYDGMIDFGNGIKALLCIVIRNKLKHIAYLFDHFSIFDSVTRKYYSTDNNIVNYRKLGDKDGGYISEDVHERFDMIMENYDPYWGFVMCSCEDKNFTMVITQEKAGYELMEKYKDFYKEYPYAFPTLFLNTWSEDNQPKRTPFSGCIGNLFKRFMSEMLGDETFSANNSLIDYIMRAASSGKSMDEIRKSGESVVNKAVERYLEDHNLDKDDYNIVDITRPVNYNKPGELDDALKDVDLDPRIVTEYINKLIELDVDLSDVKGIMASIDKETNEVSISYFDKDGKLHNPIPFSAIDTSPKDNIQFLKPSIDETDLDRFIEQNGRIPQDLLDAMGITDDEEENKDDE